MNLDELKKSMATLDDVLAQKSIEPIRLNSETCNTAQRKIMNQFRQGALSCIILGIVFPFAWSAGLGKNSFPLPYKLFMEIFCLIAAGWYGFLYFKTKKINIAANTPIQTMKQVAALRLYTLSGEITLGMAMAVFFTLFLSNLWVVGPDRFWIVIAATVIYIILLVTVFLPRTIRNFKNLTSIE